MVIESLDIGIVGLGGTGSSIAEQLTRMGANNIVLVDHDVFEPSNLSRLYGSKWEDTSIPIPKVELVKLHLKTINPYLNLEIINESVISKNVLKALSHCDIIFSCLDRHAPRALLNELSYQCYIPIIDVGAGLQRRKKIVIGGSVRATVIGPGLPCLFCQELVRPDIITAEYLSPEEYEKRRRDNYVNDLDSAVPSIINYTTMAASLGIHLFLQMMTKKDQDLFSTILFDIETNELIKLAQKIKDECVCGKRIGKGLKMPFSVAD